MVVVQNAELIQRCRLPGHVSLLDLDGQRFAIPALGPGKIPPASEYRSKVID